MNVGTSGPPQTMTQAPRLLLLSALCAGALTTVSGAALWSSPAWAQGDGDSDDSAITDKDRKRAKKVFEQGQKLFDLRRFAEALEKYQQAYEIAPLPGLLFNIGQAYRNLGDLDAALFSLRKYLKLKPDADNRDATLAYIADIEEEQRAQQAAAEARRNQLPDRDGDGDGDGDGDPDDGIRRATPAARPIYTRWWFWGGIAAVAGVGITGAILLAPDGGPPDTSLGNIDFP